MTFTQYKFEYDIDTQPFYDHYTGQPVLAGTQINSCTILLELSFTARREKKFQWPMRTHKSQQVIHPLILC